MSMGACKLDSLKDSIFAFQQVFTEKGPILAEIETKTLKKTHYGVWGRSVYWVFYGSIYLAKHLLGKNFVLSNWTVVVFVTSLPFSFQQICTLSYKLWFSWFTRDICNKMTKQ